MEFNDLPEPLRDLLNSLGRGRRENQESKAVWQRAKDALNPSWLEVISAKEAVEMFYSGSKEYAEHTATCTSLDCQMNHSIGFATPEVFLTYIGATCKSMLKLDTEAKDINELWSRISVAGIESDPRYIAFRAGYDYATLELAVAKQSLRVPDLRAFYSAGQEIDTKPGIDRV